MKKLFAVLTLFVLLLSLSACELSNLPSAYEEDTTLDYTLPLADGSSFDMTGDRAAEYLALPADTSVHEFIKPYLDQTMTTDRRGNPVYDTPDMRNLRFDLPNPVTLKFDIPKEMRGQLLSVDVFYYRTEGEDAARVVTATLEKNVATAEIYNLYTDCEYTYYVQLHYPNAIVTTADATFRTEAGVRALAIDGLYNVRDIGGWKAGEQQIKQGMVYRGTQFDGLYNEPTFFLTEKGKEEISFLGIQTDIDLREGNVRKSPLGEDVTLQNYVVGYYTEAFTSKTSKNLYGKILKQFAVEENYPIYVHCTYGADRTGTVCILLEALLGVSEEDIIKEYELTGLFLGSVSRERYLRPDFLPMLESLKEFPGKTLQEKAVYFAKSAGVTEEEIAAIRELLLE